MRSNSAITVQIADELVDGDTMDVKAVSLDGDYGLSLAMFRTMIGPPPPYDRPEGQRITYGGDAEGSWPGNLCCRGQEASDDWRSRPGGRRSTLNGTRRERPPISCYHFRGLNRVS